MSVDRPKVTQGWMSFLSNIAKEKAAKDRSEPGGSYEARPEHSPEPAPEQPAEHAHTTLVQRVLGRYEDSVPPDDISEAPAPDYVPEEGDGVPVEPAPVVEEPAHGYVHEEPVFDPSDYDSFEVAPDTSGSLFSDGESDDIASVLEREVEGAAADGGQVPDDRLCGDDIDTVLVDIREEPPRRGYVPDGRDEVTQQFTVPDEVSDIGSSGRILRSEIYEVTPDGEIAHLTIEEGGQPVLDSVERGVFKRNTLPPGPPMYGKDLSTYRKPDPAVKKLKPGREVRQRVNPKSPDYWRSSPDYHRLAAQYGLDMDSCNTANDFLKEVTLAMTKAAIDKR